MRTIILFLILFLVACVSSGSRVDNSQLRKPAQTPLSETDLTFSDLKVYLDRHNFSRIQDLLEFLASDRADKPDYKLYLSGHTFAFKSKSLHESSYRFPRAIVYGRTGKFIITFNGHSSHKGFNLLETVEFNDQSKSFEFREIEFREDAEPSPRFKDKNFIISEVGGPNGKCLTCHANARPIWENYKMWPGMYGGMDDNFTFILNGKMKVDPKLVSPSIKDKYTKFDQTKKGTRYAVLGNFIETTLEGQSTGFRPNGYLTEILSSLNIERVQRILERMGPKKITPELCAKWTSAKPFESGAHAIRRRRLEHLAQIGTQICEENASSLYFSDCMEEHANWAKDKLAFDTLNENGESYLLYAKIENLFPELKAETFSVTHTPGTYFWQDGITPIYLGITELLNQFGRKIDHDCSQL